jgi:hypothetical protein
MYLYAASRRLATANDRNGTSVTFTVLDPGFMPGSGLARSHPGPVRFLITKVMANMIPVMHVLYSPNTHTPKHSGPILAKIALAAEFEGVSGVYLEGLKEIKSSVESYEEAKQEDLWSWTVETLARNDEEKKLFEFESIGSAGTQV